MTTNYPSRQVVRAAPLRVFNLLYPCLPPSNFIPFFLRLNSSQHGDDGIINNGSIRCGIGTSLFTPAK
eukprot:scaffold825_cov196-Alexandrium_tamarense.AAC.5